ncbi:neuritin-like isoform X2 [Petromyzon marinus]|uniref:Neuritin-like n=1 Tax=Petromyzon marinus TaxID=7757 RepID=A0AAJ7U1S0_PETMA|nr:neuritin-like [Petromyzon marinus]XP_032827071.1 neuritin-like [Petromyzon marinus]
MGPSTCLWLMWIPLILQCVGAASLGEMGPDSPAGCEGVYRGMGACLLRFGDQVNRLFEHGVKTWPGERSVCTYWDEYHECKAEVLTDCPPDAARKLMLLQQELDRINGPGGLFQLCHVPAANAGAAAATAASAAAASARLVLTIAAAVVVVLSRERL